MCLTKDMSKSAAAFATVRKKIELLVQRRAPVGISSLLAKYQDEYKQPLDFKALGYGKLSNLLNAIPSIQQKHIISGKETRLSYNGTEDTQKVSKTKTNAPNPSVLAGVRENILKLVRSKGSVKIGGFTRLYEEEFKQTLDFKALGYGSLSRLLAGIPTIILEPSAKRDSYTLKVEGMGTFGLPNSAISPDSKEKDDNSCGVDRRSTIHSHSFKDRIEEKSNQTQAQETQKFPSQFIEKAYLVRESDFPLLKNAAIFALRRDGADSEGEIVYLNTHEPFSLVSIGVPGAGKSHTLACVLESCLLPTTDIVRLQKPMTALVLHYDENTLSICEAAGLLKSPTSAQSSHVFQSKAVILVSRTYYKQRKAFYGDYCTVRPLLFKWETLTADRIKRIMHIGLDDNQLYFATIMNILRRYQKQAYVPNFQVFLREVKEECSCSGQQGPLAQRIKLLETLVAESDVNQDIVDESLDLSDALFAGHNLVVADLTDPLLSKEDVNGLFEVMVEQFRTTPLQGGKVLALDEAHKFMNGTRSDNLSEAVVRVARLIRHEGMRLVVSTQSPRSLAPELLELSSVAVLHHFHSYDWLEYVKQKVPLPDDAFQTILSLRPGEAMTFASRTTFSAKVMQVRVRHRLTADFGESRRNN
jgi:hypothetical protein